MTLSAATISISISSPPRTSFAAFRDADYVDDEGMMMMIAEAGVLAKGQVESRRRGGRV